MNSDLNKSISVVLPVDYFIFLKKTNSKTMKLTLKVSAVLLIAFFITTSISFSQDCGNEGSKTASGSDEPVGTKVDGGMLYGASIDPNISVVSYSDLLSGLNESNGKTVVVKGKVSEVCQAMGCWMTMDENGTVTRVKTGHEFLLPKDISGREAIVTGKFVISEISEDDAKHYNDESSNPKKSEDIVGPQKAYEIEASGIVILDAAGK